jgi:hypothetical protein
MSARFARGHSPELMRFANTTRLGVSNVTQGIKVKKYLQGFLSRRADV